MRGIFKYAAPFCLAATMVPASDRLTALPQEDRAQWSAVGLVTSKGPDGAVLCSGTLVAPDFVITAAHCVAHKTGLMEGIQFIAGMDGTRRVATSSAVEVIRYPVWDHATKSNRLRLDLAGLRLGRLIPQDKVRAAKLVPEDSALPHKGALLGYQNSANKALHGRFDCTLERSQTISVLVSDCAVTNGNSGGPVMVKKGDDWLMVGIIVARNESSGVSMLVEVNDWLRELVRVAQKRETVRSATAE